MIHPPPRTTLFPYTTLFRSILHRDHPGRDHEAAQRLAEGALGGRAGHDPDALAAEVHDALDARRVRGEEAASVEEGRHREIDERLPRQRGGRRATLDVDGAVDDRLDP